VRRGIVLVVVLAAGTVSLAVRAYQQPAAGGQRPAPNVVQMERLKDNLFVIKGGGGSGNSAVFVTTTGVVVVDTMSPGWGQPLLDKIRELTPKPVTTIINTHTHGDHVSGNVEFPATVDIVAQENTKRFMEEHNPTLGIAEPIGHALDLFRASNGQGLPTRTFRDRMSLGAGGDRIDLYYFGRGHTGGDAWVVFPTLRILHAGDMFARKSIPVIDANNGGSGIEYPRTLNAAYASLKDSVDTIITGHSTQMTPNDLKEFSDFMSEFVAAVQDAKRAGRTAEEFANTWTVPAKYTGYTNRMPEMWKVYAQVIYNETN
jgi:glyoxylase-like metal-dependent hydrolase (beta-lactamase superfamily II)